MTTQPTTSSATFAGRLRVAVQEETRSVPAHRRARNWHGAAQRSVANPQRTRGLSAEDFAERLRRAVG